MTKQGAAVLVVAGALSLQACGGEGSSESGVSIADPRAVGVAFVEGIAGRDPAVCELAGSGMVTELTATAPDKSCAEAVESGDAQNIFFVADGEEILDALPDAELEPVRQGPAGEQAQRLSIEPGPGAEFTVILVPAPDGEGWQVEATTAGQTEPVAGGEGTKRAD